MSLLDGDCNDYGKRYDLSDEDIETLLKIIEDCNLSNFKDTYEPISIILNEYLTLKEYQGRVLIPVFDMDFDINYN